MERRRHQLGLNGTEDYERLYRYSLRITGSKWEAEDLAQESMLKLYLAMEKNPAREIGNAYLYRIALNAWRDKKRKQGGNRLETLNDCLADQGGHDSRLDTRELLEILADRLSPRALVILLLMDVFGFTAKETAEMIASAEGAVQVTLGRARARLKKLAGLISHDGYELGKPSPLRREEDGQLDFEALVDAFRRKDVKAICRSYRGLVKHRFSLSGLEIAGGRLCFYIADPDDNRFILTE